MSSEKRKHQRWAQEVKKLRDSLGSNVSQRQACDILAERTGLNVVQQIWGSWETGKTEPTETQYIALAKLAGPPEGWFFFRGAGLSDSDIYPFMADVQDRVLSRIESRRVEPIKVIPRDAIKGGRRKAMEVGHVAIPLLSDPAAAGSPRIIDEQIIEGDIIVPAGVVRHPIDTVCIKVSGDSMAPILQEGYIVVVDAAQRDPARLVHQMIVVKELTSDDAGVTIKHLERFGREYVLTPENKAYRPQAMTREHHIIGRVIWWQGHKD